MLPYNKPAVIIGKDGLEARLVLVPVEKEPPGSGYWLPSLAELEIVLREEGVNAPMDQISLKSALERVAAGLRVEAVAARGRAPEPGKDGWIEYLVDLSGPIPPAQAEGGSVDLRSSSLIRNVKSGQPLAMVHPPRVGKAGMDVWGKILPSRPGRDVDPKLGPNIKRSQHDPSLLVSATDGHVLLSQGRLEVEECFLVAGDVDYASGNIAFAKSVLVQGDVKSGFAVEAGGEVEIQGLVEDCAIKAKGRILVRGGFTGSGKGLLEAKGEVALGYVRNQTVRAEGDITVTREAVNSRIQCRGRLTVNGLLTGGKIQAFHSIACQVAGTETGTPTLLEAGYDYAVAEEMAGVRKELGEMGSYAKKLEDGLKHLGDLEKVNRGVVRWSVELVFEMERMKSKVDAKIAGLRARFAELEAKAGDGSQAVVHIRRKAFPGTVIKIGADVYRVEEPLEGPKSFRSREGLIEMRSEGGPRPEARTDGEETSRPGPGTPPRPDEAACAEAPRPAGPPGLKDPP